jgi:hypothetical protein
MGGMRGVRRSQGGSRDDPKCFPTVPILPYGTKVVKRVVHHANDLGAFIVDHAPLPCRQRASTQGVGHARVRYLFHVPQSGHADPPLHAQID